MADQKHWRDLAITGFALLVEALALLFGVSILTLGAATLLWLALQDYRKEHLRRATRSYRINFGILSALLLVMVTTVIPIGIKSYFQGRPPLSHAGPLAEWQQTLVLTTLSEFKGSKVLILVGVGEETLAYANQFRDLFKQAGWTVRGPELAPRDQVVLDVSIGLDLRIGSHPEVPTILSGFTSAGIKHRPGGMRSPNIPDDWLVLWVGSESPEGEPLFKPLEVPKGTFDKIQQ
jgi:hypothetical protein